jgi:formate/nitrite transporter FocA (FNT family)
MVEQEKLNETQTHEELEEIVPKRPRPAEIYDSILNEGEEELERSVPALWWSGLAAGLSMGFSVVASAALAAAFSGQSWTHPIISVGYSVGFVIVIMARQQLFTENTITALLPVLAKRSWVNINHMLRLWGVVLAANLLGAMIFAWLTTMPALFGDHLRAEFLVLGQHLFHNSAIEMFTKGIAAGWLIAALVWVLPSVKVGKMWVIIFFTSLIALGEFTHIIAGSIESFHMLFVGEIGWNQLLMQFMFPTLIGNIVGGSAIFSLASYAQVRREVI